jgi:hypothetical protein
MYLRKGNRTIDVNAMANVYDGYAIENPNWDDGPLDDWDQDSTAVVQAVFTDIVPAVSIGLQKVPGAVAATGANAGTPGTFTPAGAAAPADLAAMSSVAATPTTAWTTGQYVTLGDASQAFWDGGAWQVGAAP